MGAMKIKLTVPLLIIALSSCEKFEMRGFFTSYENVNTRFNSSIEWNTLHGHTEISVPLETYSLYAMGDSHVGGTRNIDQFFQDGRDNKATAVVLTGDLTTGHKEDYDLFMEHLPLKDSLMHFAIAGNHDLFFDGWQYFYSAFGSSSYFFVVNTPGASDLFICLDSGGGTLGSRQSAWLKNLLESNRDNYRYCTVFTHNNIFRFRPVTSTHPMVEEVYFLLDLFTRHNVNMVVTAHDHKRNTGILGNTTHIIMDALQDINDDASYLKLTVTEEAIDFSFVDL